MSSKWFKVETDFVDHPKVDQFCRLIGEPLGGWYLLRMWSWVSRFCPTGHVMGHLILSLETSLKWPKEAGELVDALVVCGFVDRDSDGSINIHDWSEYQGKVHENAEKSRIRKQEYRRNLSHNLSRGTSSGTNVGQIPTGRDGTGRDGTGRDVKVLRTLVKPEKPKAEDPEAMSLCDAWNSFKNPKQPQCLALSPSRVRHAKARLAERPLAQWVEIVSRIAASEFCCGSGRDGWVSGFDWLVRPGTADMVLEGKYDNRKLQAPTRAADNTKLGTGPNIATEIQF